MSEIKKYYVYIMTDKQSDTLYTGVISDTAVRIYLQREAIMRANFSNSCQVFKLVYYEIHGSMHQAMRREKQIKKLQKNWKVRLIESINPHWFDLGGRLV